MFNSIEEALEEIRSGGGVVVLDDEDRENEGDLVTSAELIDKDKINFMITHCRGLVCVPMCKERLRELDIGLMVEGQDFDQAAFTVSVDHKLAGTGISAGDRALTIKKLVDKDCLPEDLIRPGHIFPLKAQCNGVLEREGHTEATVDLMKLAGLKPAGVLCEILKEDGNPGRRDYLLEFAKKYNFKIITIESLKKYIEDKKINNFKLLEYI